MTTITLTGKIVHGEATLATLDANNITFLENMAGEPAEWETTLELFTLENSAEFRAFIGNVLGKKKWITTTLSDET